MRPIKMAAGVECTCGQRKAKRTQLMPRGEVHSIDLIYDLIYADNHKCTSFPALSLLIQICSLVERSQGNSLP